MKPFDSASAQVAAWAETADRYELLIAAPEIASGSATKEFPLRHLSPELQHDATATRAMIDAVRAQYNVDPQRIYLVGRFSGGYLLHYLAHLQPDTFAAVFSDESTFSSEVLQAIPTANIERLTGNQVAIAICSSDRSVALIRADSREALKWYGQRRVLVEPIRPEGRETGYRPELAASFFAKHARVAKEPSDVAPMLAGGQSPVAATGAVAGDAAPGPILHRWAVTVGVNCSRDSRVPELRFAEQDASAFADNLVRQCGFSQDNVRVLLGRQATQREIRSALGTFLARNAGKDDLVVIFFSGHGAPEPDLTSKAPDGYLKYLVPYDANKDDLFATAIPMSEIATYFERIELGGSSFSRIRATAVPQVAELSPWVGTRASPSPATSWMRSPKGKAG